MISVHYYVPHSDANGVKVITHNFVEALNRKGISCVVTESLPEDKSLFVIPGGVKNGAQLIRKGFKPTFIILGDAITLGYKNKIKWYLKVGHFLNKDFLYSIFGYLRYYKEEKLVAKSYEKIVLFSKIDVDYILECFNSSDERFICIPNGAKLPEPLKYKTSKFNKIRIGILSAWGDYQAFEENNWFIQKYWLKFQKSHPEYELILAGRGAQLNRIKNKNGITVLGEVRELGDFFSAIDFFLTVNPKGCGILNRVLDAMAFKVPVIGLDASFSGFPNSDSIFVKFTDYNSFVRAMEYVINPNSDVPQRVEAAYDYLLKNNNWENNYDKLVNFLLSD